MRRSSVARFMAMFLAFGLPLILVHPAFAADANVTQVETFIRSIIKVIAGLAGLVATGFVVVGAFGYITSSGNPEHLDRSKRTLLFASLGLAITIGAFVFSNIVTSLATSAFGS